jgi:hypothetical protein
MSMTFGTGVDSHGPYSFFQCKLGDDWEWCWATALQELDAEREPLFDPNRRALARAERLTGEPKIVNLGRAVNRVILRGF